MKTNHFITSTENEGARERNIFLRILRGARNDAIECAESKKRRMCVFHG